MAQRVECLPHQLEALSSKHSTKNRKQKKGKKMNPKLAEENKQ
jgi:hypothetical protein